MAAAGGSCPCRNYWNRLDYGLQAIKIGETNVVMPLDFSKLVWASLIGFVIFAEVPTIYTWIGGAMIFAAALYIAYRESQAARAEQRTVTGVSGVAAD